MATPRAMTPRRSGDEAGDARTLPSSRASTERIDQIRAAADAAALVVTAGVNLRAALAGLDEIAEQAAQARRTLKAAIGGRKAPATRPGGLRDNVLAHLQANPGTEFTPHQIHNALGNSSGAIANALDILVKRGDAELSCEKPRRFRLAASAPDTAAETPPPPTARARRRHGAGGCRVTIPADGRGGSMPPRPPAAGQPQQWFMLRPWLFDVTAATRLLRAAPRPRAAAAGHGLGTRLRAAPRPRRQPAHRFPDRPRPGLRPAVRHEHRPGRAADHRQRHRPTAPGSRTRY